MTEIRRTPQLAKCEPVSLLGAIIQSAQVGLEVGSVLGHAYLVPFWNNKSKYMEVQFIPGYRGLMELARRSGVVKKITAHAVYSKDVFDFEYGMNERLIHKPEFKGPRGDIVCAYAVATLDDGCHVIEVVSIDDINKIKNDSISKIKPEYQKYSPWNNYYDEMARKTAVRRIIKYLPISLDKHQKLAEAIKLDNQRDDDPFYGAAEIIDTPIKDIAPIPPPTEGQAELEQMKDEEIEELIGVAKERIKACKDLGKITALEQKFKVRGLDDLYNLDAKQISDLIAFVG